MRKLFSTLLFAVLFLQSGFAQDYPLRDEYMATSRTVGQIITERGPSSVNWINGGDRYSYITFDSETRQRIINISDPKTGKDEVIFDGKGVNFPGTEKAFTYQSFQWSADSKYLLFKTNFRPIYRRSGVADFYLYSIADKSLVEAAKDARTAELSPDGKLMGFERGGNLFVREMATGVETQLTTDGNDDKHIFNGHFGWVYEEEFGLSQAWEWSPDSRYIAYWQEDENGVPEFQMTDYEGQHEEYTKIRYPRVGDTNPTVRIGVITLADKSNKWLDVKETGEHYIPRINWTGQDHFLSVMVLNRKQNHLKLHFFDARNGEGNLVMEEKSETWIDVFDFFAGINHLLFFPQGGKEFFWISDRDGFSHLYRYDYKGKLLNQVTKGNWEVTFVHGFDTKKDKIYFSSTEVSPVDRHLFVVDYKGKKKEQITKVAGRHNINASPNGKYFIDSYSNINQPLTVELWDAAKKKVLKTLADNKASFEKVKSEVQLRELFSFTTSDGQKLDGYLIKPHNFDSTKNYPLVLDIYGGPGAQSVYNEFGVSGWQQHLQKQGFVIASVNNRGSGGYGSAFEKVVYRHLGDKEAFDFAETAKYLGSYSWIDENNMAIRGHSYGGYMSSYTMANQPGVFKAAIIAAPVTDWRLYDSIYTERYMDLMSDNNDGYTGTSVMTNAKNVKGKLLIVHSTMDENVHVQNTFQLLTTLTSAGIDAEVRIYPPGAHGVAYDGASRLLLYGQVYAQFLIDNLKN
ncbi:S9 family peptidase [bacterium]|nr:MAG: S9 family peptidase [bacterium]